jgi:hypothetical protein
MYCLQHLYPPESRCQMMFFVDGIFQPWHELTDNHCRNGRWMWCRGKWSQPILRPFQQLFIGDWGKSGKSSEQLAFVWEFNPVPLEYEAGVCRKARCAALLSYSGYVNVACLALLLDSLSMLWRLGGHPARAVRSYLRSHIFCTCFSTLPWNYNYVAFIRRYSEQFMD